MKISLKGKTAIITGANRGIGITLAQTLFEEGLNLALTMRTITEDVQKLVNLAEGTGQKVNIYLGELGDIHFPNQLIKKVIKDFKSIDIVINNAGIAQASAIEDTSTELWDMHMEINARAPFMICREAIPFLKLSDCASIINISSVVGIKGYVNQGAYTASKHALMGMTKVLAQEVANDGIRVHSICPGGVETDMVTKTRPDLDRSVLIKPEEVAEVIMFLLKNRGNAMIDDIHIRRISNDPWF